MSGTSGAYAAPLARGFAARAFFARTGLTEAGYSFARAYLAARFLDSCPLAYNRAVSLGNVLRAEGGRLAWVRVAAESELADGAGIECLAGERLVALFRVGGEIFALDGVCPHQGGPLGQGTLDGTCVACPWHGWQFDLRTGRQQFSPTLRQPTFPVRVESGEIFVQLEEA